LCYREFQGFLREKNNTNRWTEILEEGKISKEDLSSLAAIRLHGENTN